MWVITVPYQLKTFPTSTKNGVSTDTKHGSSGISTNAKLG
jgi:hypothetical protein